MFAATRLRMYSIEKLLRYELTSTFFYLTKDEFLRKPQKSELTKEIEKNMQTPPPAAIPQDDEATAIMIDFMAYARKVAVKKLNLMTFGRILTLRGCECTA